MSLCVFLYLLSRVNRKKHPPLPPGPPADPLIGHMRLIAGDHQETLFYEWGKKYGDVMYLHVLGKPIVVLNSVKAAVELLDQRSANYSDRPRFVVMEIMGWARALAFMGYGRVFQKHRRMLYNYLRQRRCVAYRPIQIREARVLLLNLLSNEEHREDCLTRFATSIIIAVTVGHQITSDDDPYIAIAQGVSHAQGNTGSPGCTPVDFFPFLRYLPSWIPGAYYATFARDNSAVIDALHDYPYEEVRRNMAKGEVKPSFMLNQLEVLDREGTDGADALSDIKGAAGVMYCAGSDTTFSTLSFFFFAMLTHPEAQTRAQKEIDEVVGFGRLPDFEDRGSLPYIECILQETLRWHGAVPLGVPHRSLQDDIYRGMFIPKGSLVK